MRDFSGKRRTPSSLGPGEQRRMRPGQLLGEEKDRVIIIAECFDEDSPFVILRDPTTNTEIHMSDVLAEDVARRIHRALRILPTSK